MNAENGSAQLIRPSRHTKPRIPAKSATSFRMTLCYSVCDFFFLMSQNHDIKNYAHFVDF
jgi:hypothetical protein